MYNNKKYILTISICIFALVFLIFKNYIVLKTINERQKKIIQVKVNEEDNYKSIREFGYSDIISVFEKQQGIKIVKFIQQKESDIASVEVEILGDISTVEKVLKNIESKDNFHNVQNIKIERCEDNNIIARLNVNFIKNK
ncbi:hypothetical protein [Clostridium magnum]|uniref:Uncharacterized protein n=1 Tax=Clostridium magnum DSM 2767 TaxID=1121326 RepID=A0A161X3W5_9CLOT|nr:hypothetical protein [Clostridium magnum]KZL94208.1 hypothetical protein CLMAG_12610 [Clostridium magnum DSM 2767]SHH92792.1 hypothetical protein SAMN02745944_01792 [Clostridium magnum DSM 2767]